MHAYNVHIVILLTWNRTVNLYILPYYRSIIICIYDFTNTTGTTSSALIKGVYNYAYFRGTFVHFCVHVHTCSWDYEFVCRLDHGVSLFGGSLVESFQLLLLLPPCVS